MQWQGPLTKISERVKLMAAAGVPPSAAVHYFDQYVAQVCAAQDDVVNAYELAAQRILHFPHRALPKSFGQLLGVIGMRPMKCPLEQCAATLLRSALHLAPEVAECAAAIKAARADVDTLATLAADAPPPEAAWWGAPATVDIMKGVLGTSGRQGQSAAQAEATRGRRGRRAATKPGCEDLVAFAATALRPLIRKFMYAQCISDALLVKASARTLSAVSHCAPVFGAAHGAVLGPQHFGEARFCFPMPGLRPSRLRCCASLALMRDPLARGRECHKHSDPHVPCRHVVPCPIASNPGDQPEASDEASMAVMSLTIGCEAYHKLAGAIRSRGATSSLGRDRQVAAAVRHAHRRLWDS